MIKMKDGYGNSCMDFIKGKYLEEFRAQHDGKLICAVFENFEYILTYPKCIKCSKPVSVQTIKSIYDEQFYADHIKPDLAAAKELLYANRKNLIQRQLEEIYAIFAMLYESQDILEFPTRSGAEFFFRATAIEKSNVSYLLEIEPEGKEFNLNDVSSLSFTHYRNVNSKSKGIFKALGYLYLEHVIITRNQAGLKDLIELIRLQSGEYNFGESKREIYETLLGYLEQILRKTDASSRPAVYSLLHDMANSKAFGRCLSKMLQILAKNFITMHKDLLINETTFSILMSEPGKAVEANLLALALALRVSLDVIDRDTSSQINTKVSHFKAAYPDFMLKLNDSLNLHENTLSLYKDDQGNVKCLYAFQPDSPVYKETLLAILRGSRRSFSVFSSKVGDRGMVGSEEKADEDVARMPLMSDVSFPQNYSVQRAKKSKCALYFGLIMCLIILIGAVSLVIYFSGAHK